MATEHLKQTLLTLHAQLSSGEQLDPELQDLLRLLDADIRTRLAASSITAPAATNSYTTTGVRTESTSDTAGATSNTGRSSDTMANSSTDAATPAPTGLSSRAQEISARFAAAHPHLEPVLRELTDTLQRIGI
jgi:hypothetical protein